MATQTGQPSVSLFGDPNLGGARSGKDILLALALELIAVGTAQAQPHFLTHNGPSLLPMVELIEPARLASVGRF